VLGSPFNVSVEPPGPTLDIVLLVEFTLSVDDPTVKLVPSYLKFAEELMAEVPFPYRISPAGLLVRPVPPLETSSVPNDADLPNESRIKYDPVYRRVI
jgi:hypothetical protein